MMRFALLWAFVASFAASAIGRQPLPEVSANDSRFQPYLKPLVGNRAVTTPPPDTSSTPDIPLNNDNEPDKGPANVPLADPASDELWYKHMRKGSSLNCGMCGTDIGAGYQLDDMRTPPSAASKWVGGVLELVDWYWWEGYYDSRICEMDVYWGMGSMFQALGISPRSTTAGGDLHCFQLRHKNENAKYPDGNPKEALAQSYVAEGRTYHATDASHFFSMNVRAGVIIGIALLGPEISAERIWGWKPSPDQLPKLRNLSDLYWAYWSSLHNAAGTRVDNINTYIVYSIQNPQTDQIITRALKSIGKEELEPWPGQYFSIESTQGLVLLGSPIGATIGYLLMQHKKELGNKYVAGVRILRNDEQADYAIQEADLVFYIENVPLEKSIPDVPGQDPPQGRPQSDSFPTTQLGHLALRNLPGHPIEERVFGPKNVVRVHTIMNY